MNGAGEATCTRCDRPAGAHAEAHPALATRVMTARWDHTVCPRCRLTIRRGDRIGQVDGKWLHIECVTGRFGTRPDWPGAA